MLENIEIPKDIARKIDQYYKCGTRTPASEELTTLLLELVTLFLEVYIVIDGIDECEGQERRDILSVINRLVGYEKQVVRVFVASQDNIDIRRSFAGYCRIGISEASVQSDINSYVGATVNAKVRDATLIVRDCKLVNTIIETLSHGAQGMFLWVAFQLDELSEATSDHEIRNILQNLPKDLAETYRRILRRIRTSKRGEEKTGMARKIFQWISCARRPLTVEELKEAVAFEPMDCVWNAEKIPTDSSQLIQACGNLVIVDEDDETVRLVHSTVLQFLTSAPTDELIADFQFECQQADLRAGEICVTYLSFSDFETQMTLRPNHALRDMQLLESAFSNRTTYLQGYSKSLWDIWNVVWGSPAPQNQPRVDFGRVLNREKPSPRDFTQKYLFLNYAIDHWVWHTTRFSEENTSTWHLFRDLALEKLLPFDFRAWGEVLVAKDLPYLPLFLWAVESGRVPLLTLLVKPPWGVDLRGYFEHESRYAQSPLALAACNGHAGVLEFLLEASDSSALDSNLLHLAVASGRSEPVRVLLDRKCDPDAKNSDGRTALEVAVESEFELTVKELLTYGAEADHKDPGGRTLLAVAVKNGHEAVARLLLNKGADVAAKNGAGWTALHWAAWKGQEAVSRLLLEKGADVAAKDRMKKTALHRAAWVGEDAVVRLLLENGADVAAKDGRGKTALQWATQNGHEAVTRLLAPLTSNS